MLLLIPCTHLSWNFAKRVPRTRPHCLCEKIDDRESSKTDEFFRGGCWHYERPRILLRTNFNHATPDSRSKRATTALPGSGTDLKISTGKYDENWRSALRAQRLLPEKLAAWRHRCSARPYALPAQTPNSFSRTGAAASLDSSLRLSLPPSF